MTLKEEEEEEMVTTEKRVCPVLRERATRTEEREKRGWLRNRLHQCPDLLREISKHHVQIARWRNMYRDQTVVNFGKINIAFVKRKNLKCDKVNETF